MNPFVLATWKMIVVVLEVIRLPGRGFREPCCRDEGEIGPVVAVEHLLGRVAPKLATVVL